MEPEEVLLLGYDAPKKPAVQTIRLVGLGHEASAMIAILERMAIEKFPLGTELVFLVEKEEASRISGGMGCIEGGGVFGHFPAEPKRYVMESDGARLSQAIVKAMSFLEGKFTYSPDRRKDNLNAQVNPYAPPGRSAALLRSAARKKR